MAKVHLDIRDDIAPEIALECVKKVVREGRISNGGKSYSYATIFETSIGSVMVATRQYRKSDCFLIYKVK